MSGCFDAQPRQQQNHGSTHRLQEHHLRRAVGVAECTEAALQAGVQPSQIIWDPGLGFAKTHEQNLQLLRELEQLNQDGFPLLIGPSRKRFIGDVLNEPRPKARLWGTAAVACRCAQAKAAIVRVHDVGAIAQTLRMASALW
jgi:dihydropteroate synthase